MIKALKMKKKKIAELIVKVLELNEKSRKK